MCGASSIPPQKPIVAPGPVLLELAQVTTGGKGRVALKGVSLTIRRARSSASPASPGTGSASWPTWSPVCCRRIRARSRSAR